ncbi:SDR family oxidoreductase [Mesobaculum littorinae]|uniref:SDR family oxidoreductase n=1 Tax=Mesobaculum littorinae TaxID=2486419 RepID=A0A438AGU1_9RHOB|nr:SDR family oxidoreductase [Mesobaculum littorinae]RVV97923.1 SDR family oxidoreductase [Mesobaculum littorinae]
MILVTGATGDIGGEVCRLLHDAGTPFRAMCRKQEQINAFREKGIDAVLGDFDRPDTLTGAMEGCESMLLLSGPSPDQTDREIRAIDAAKAAGVSRIVKISASDSNLRTPVPWAQAHAHIDHHLRASGLRWTILRPTAYMQNLLWFKDPISKGVLPQTSGKGCASWVDTRDVARVAVTVLTEGGHDKATYFLTGPEALDMRDISRRLSDVLGRKVRFVNLPKSAFWGLMRAVGTSQWMAKGLAVQFADVVAGHHAVDPTSEVERLTGVPPHDFEQFASDYRAQFVKAA